MKKFILLVINLLLIIITPGYTQSTYQVGTGQAGIEPDKTFITLHLGGYGAPRDGRFTLQWNYMENLPDITAITGINDQLFIINNGELLKKTILNNSDTWIKAGKAGQMKYLAGANGRIYASSGNGDLLTGKISGTTKWKKAGTIDRSVIALTGSGSRLFAANNNGSVWFADISDMPLHWFKMKELEGITSLAANDRKLFAATDNGFIYQCEYRSKDQKWLKAAYKNNATIREDIHRIAIAGNTIFGVNNENILYGGSHRSKGDLTARAMAVRGGDKTVVIVNVDVCGLNDTYTGLLKEEIYKKHRIPASAIFINSSHTHFAPVSQFWLTWQEANQRPDSLYLYKTVWNGINNAIDNALNSMAPSEIYFGRGKTDIGYNRSLRDHQELYDSSVDVIKIAGIENKEENYLFLASCHPVFSTAGTLHYTISANYPGVARKLVEERTGTSNSLFLQGTAGDINPRDNGEYISGEKLANEVISVLSRPMTRIGGDITYYLDTLNIPVEPWSKEEIIKYREENIKEPGNINAEKNVKWCDLMLQYYSEGKMPVTMPVYINTINIGNWKLVGFSRETTTEYGFGVKNMWPEKLISVAGYTNDVSSYLPTHKHIEKKNYEGLNSFFWYGMPNTFPMTVDNTILGTIRSLER